MEQNPTKVFNFPIRSLWDIWKELSESQFLSLIEIEKIREEKSPLFLASLEKEKWIFEQGLLKKNLKKNLIGLNYWRLMQRLGAFLRSRPEFATNDIVNKMRETKALSNFSNIVIFKESASGVSVPLVPSGGYHTKSRETAIQRMEEIYYTNLNNALKAQKGILAEVYKRTKGKTSELPSLNLKELAYISQRLAIILESFRKKQGAGILINLNLSQGKREDYWKTYNKYIEDNLKQ